MKIIFRTDASLTIGTGHVMRCLTLAHALRKSGFLCIFICRDLVGHMKDAIQKNGFECHLLVSSNDLTLNSPPLTAHAHWLECPWELDASQTMALVEKIQPKWLIVDHYGLNDQWENVLQKLPVQLFVIDDLADRKHSCDVLLDQNIGRTASDYSELIPKEATVLIGTNYALLREEFTEYRTISLQNRLRPIQTLTISMGGVDQENTTERILDQLIRYEYYQKLSITVILGKACPWINQIKKKAMMFAMPLNICINVTNMAEILSETDVAIGAAGSSAWERCCLGIPSLSITIAKNQETIASFLEKQQISLVLAQTDISTGRMMNALNTLCQDTPLRTMLSNNSSHLIDGKGVSRVIEVFHS